MKSRLADQGLNLYLFPELEARRNAVNARQIESAKVQFMQMGGTAAQLAVDHRAKSLGAYYTDSQVADFLVRWAVRSAGDRILDPSFGGGVFLRSGSKRLQALGGNPGNQVFGIELATDVHAEIAGLLHGEFRIANSNLVCSDFFDVLPTAMPKMDAVVGNPPFIRYQRFSGEVRTRALNRAAEAGIKLSSLASSWLPFLVHSVRFLNSGGNLAMVIPFEIAHAAYARPVLRYLAERFKQVTFLTFRRRLFSELSEDTLLLLAETRQPAGRLARFRLRDLGYSGDLSTLLPERKSSLGGVRKLDTKRIASGEERLIESLIPGQARGLYRELQDSPTTEQLGRLADVGIGYVTGANDFFHLSPAEVAAWGIPDCFLRRSVRRGRALSGLLYTREDWQEQLETGEAGYLLNLPSSEPLPNSVKRYLEYGKEKSVHETFKCRTREPWYRVPHVHLPDGLLTYMSGGTPKLVANGARAVAPNSLHVVRLHDGAAVTSRSLAALWQTSLTRLSVEIEGHALGGGMLKLEPTEAERILLPNPSSHAGLDALASELDGLIRDKGLDAGTELADELILKKNLGLMTSDIQLLREAGDSLRARRTSRSRK